MVLWVAELSAEAVGKDNVYVATEDERIANTVAGAGFAAVMTGGDALTGTDRVAQAAEQIDAGVYLNVQGDEPLLNPRDICSIRDAKLDHPEAVINGWCWMSGDEDPGSVNIPKVIGTESGRLVYMSRMPLPGFKDPANAPERYKKQVCIYAFSRAELESFSAFGRKSELEAREDIEILRFLEIGKQVLLVETGGGSLAVDVPADVVPVERALRKVHGS